MEREPRYFEYGEAEVAYLAARDPRLGEAMAVIGRIEREVHPDLFAALVNCIVGQQIATKAQTTIWNRMLERFGEVTPEAMAACSDDELQQVGISFRKVGYIKGAAARVLSGEVDLEGLAELSDDEVCRTLSALPGIGVWTAEMLMTFSMQRPNILSWGDLAIHRDLRMVHHHRRITPELFAKYRRRYTPYGSVASLYLWEVAGGAIPGMKDWAPKSEKRYGGAPNAVRAFRRMFHVKHRFVRVLLSAVVVSNEKETRRIIRRVSSYPVVGDEGFEPPTLSL